MKLSTEEIEQASSEYDGFCSFCDSITRFGDTEPDAENYRWPQCETYNCFGIESAVVLGHIENDKSM